MSIRRAVLSDCIAIKKLLDQLGYPDTESFLAIKLRSILDDPTAELIVYELEEKLVAFMAIDFIVQLALKGDFARISYFVVDDVYRNKGIGELLESYCTHWAIEKGCDRIEVHCSDYRTVAHRFYKGCGYTESPKYFVKKLSVISVIRK